MKGSDSFDEYEDILEQIDKGEKIEVESQKLSYEEIADQVFYLLPASDYYAEDENGHFESIADDEAAVEHLVEENAIEVKIAGIVKPIKMQRQQPFQHRSLIQMH